MEFLQLLVLLRFLLCLLVKGQDINENLGMFPCVLLRDAALIDESLPLLRQPLHKKKK